MKQDSPLFDKIRIKKGAGKKARTEAPRCDVPGCEEKGEHRAPKGRGHEKEYWHFCLAHVREYNNSYNYFAGLPDEAVVSFQKSAATGHRPTWTMGAKNSETPPGAQTNPWAEAEIPRAFSDPFGLFHGKAREPEHKSGRPLGKLDRKAFMTLNLEISASGEDIKLRYKAMVKRFHPDANGGDRSYEDKLREIIQAYNQLKSTGFC